MKKTKILITGGRDFTDREYIESELNKFYMKYKKGIELILGGAPGVDTFAEDWARFMRVDHNVKYADWDLYGKSAGFIRNKLMAEQKPDFAIAFPGDKGTNMMIEICIRKNIPVIRRPIKECGVELWTNDNRYSEG